MCLRDFLLFSWSAPQRLKTGYYVNLYHWGRDLLSLCVAALYITFTHRHMTVVTLENWCEEPQGHLQCILLATATRSVHPHGSWISNHWPSITRPLCFPPGKRCPTFVHKVRPEMLQCVAVCAATTASTLVWVVLRLCIPQSISTAKPQHRDRDKTPKDTAFKLLGEQCMHSAVCLCVCVCVCVKQTRVCIRSRLLTIWHFKQIGNGSILSYDHRGQ